MFSGKALRLGHVEVAHQIPETWIRRAADDPKISGISGSFQATA